MKTSYYQNKKLDATKHLVVQTSVGEPRFGTMPEWEMDSMKPPEELLGLPEKEYTKAYVAHLESIGFEAFRNELAELRDEAVKTQREVVLCCFESLKKPGQFCHRRIFAWWYHKQGGIFIEELGCPLVQPALV